jgi:uncharacterized protein YggE
MYFLNPFSSLKIQQMKATYIIFIMILIAGNSFSVFAQVSGNVNYSDNKNTYNKEKSSNLYRVIPNPQFERDNSVIAEASAMYNAHADHFVAIFNIGQVGETASSANEMLENRIKGIKDGLMQLDIKEKDIFIDMLTFVPEYEYEPSKKVFSKTYNEVPKGFRIQKNIHVRYSNSKKLDQLLGVCARYEVYDLVKVDYYSQKSQAIFDSLRIAVKKILKDKLKDYKELGIGIDNASTQITESSFVIYPIEQYDNYQAFNSGSLDALKKNAIVSSVSKNVSLYYNHITEKGYDYVFNPVITEPVIQYALTMRLRLSQQATKGEPKTEYFMLSPNGTLIPIKK